MNSEQFIWWIHGFIELTDPKTISAAQLEEIRNHLKLVLDKTEITTNTPDFLKIWAEANDKADKKPFQSPSWPKIPPIPYDEPWDTDPYYPNKPYWRPEIIC